MVASGSRRSLGGNPALSEKGSCAPVSATTNAASCATVMLVLTFRRSFLPPDVRTWIVVAGALSSRAGAGGRAAGVKDPAGEAEVPPSAVPLLKAV